jgi:hypothetical protein
MHESSLHEKGGACPSGVAALGRWGAEGELLVVFGGYGGIGRRRGSASDPMDGATAGLAKQTQPTGILDVGRTVDQGLRGRDKCDGHTRHQRARAIGVDHVDGPVLEAHGTRHQGIGEIQGDVYEEKQGRAAHAHVMMVASR